MPVPVILVANKVDLERSKVVKSAEGKQLARQMSCKFIEISCTVGYNLDNLLVGLRAQLVLKHCVILDAIFAQKSFARVDNAPLPSAAAKSPESQQQDSSEALEEVPVSALRFPAGKAISQPANYKQPMAGKSLAKASKSSKCDTSSSKQHQQQSSNIFVRFYRKLINDSDDSYDCFDFGKL